MTHAIDRRRPADARARRLLGNGTIVVLFASDGRAVLGGAVACRSRRCEWPRTELDRHDR